MGVVVAILVLAAIAAGVWWSYERRRARREALLLFATQYGFDWTRDDPFHLTSYPFRLFSEGDGRGCENVLTGTWQGMPAREADYWYYTDSTDSDGRTSRTYHRFSIVLADLAWSVPEASIQRETLLSRIGDHLGFHDIEFESEDFNRRFRVGSEDREFAFKLIDDRMMAWLLSKEGSFSFEVNGPNLLVWSGRLRPTGLIPLFGTAKAFVDHVPRLVWNEYGRGQPTGSAPEGGANQP